MNSLMRLKVDAAAREYSNAQMRGFSGDRFYYHNDDKGDARISLTPEEFFDLIYGAMNRAVAVVEKRT